MFKKTFFTFVIIILLSFSVVILFVFKFTEDVINKEVISVHSQSIENDALMVEQIIDKAVNYLLLLSINENIQYNFKSIKNSNLDHFNDTQNIMEDEIRRMIFDSGYEALFFPFSSDGGIYAKSSEKIYSKTSNVSETEWYKETIIRNGKVASTIVLQEGNEYLRLSSLVYNTENWQETVGIAVIDINIHNITAPFGTTPLGRTGSVYLLDADNNVIFPHNVKRDFTVDIIREMESGPKIFFKSYLGIMEYVRPLNWKIVGYLPILELNERSRNVRKYILITAIIALVIASIAELIFSYVSSKPIKDLAATMKKRDFNDRVEIKKSFSGDIKTLYESYNYMIMQFNELIDKVYVSSIKEKDAELKLLQSQINPHFLYNTLDSISWLAMKYKADDIYVMVHSLGTMLRFSLNAGEDSITIRNELKQVESYLEIQKYRYDNSFVVKYDFNDDVMDIKIIRLILQPLVENALTHGFETFEGEKTIIIKGFMQNSETVVLEVANTGNSADLKRIKRILFDDDYHSKSYGIKNVNDRLTKTFGEDFRLSYSVDDVWTVAVIKIPLKKMIREKWNDESSGC